MLKSRTTALGSFVSFGRKLVWKLINVGHSNCLVGWKECGSMILRLVLDLLWDFWANTYKVTLHQKYRKILYLFQILAIDVFFLNFFLKALWISFDFYHVCDYFWKEKLYSSPLLHLFIANNIPTKRNTTHISKRPTSWKKMEVLSDHMAQFTHFWLQRRTHLEHVALLEVICLHAIAFILTHQGVAMTT